MYSHSSFRIWVNIQSVEDGLETLATCGEREILLDLSVIDECFITHVNGHPLDSSVSISLHSLIGIAHPYN